MPNRVSFEQQGDVVTVTLAGRIHGTNADEMDTALTHAASQAKHLILRLKDLEFVSSSGLRTFLKLRREAITKGGEVVLAEPTDAVLKILKVASLDHLFTVTASLEEAQKQVADK